MDSNDFMLYGDESMENAAIWTNTGKRSVVTVSCLNVDPNQPTEQCGTRVLSGLPTLTERAVKGIDHRGRHCFTAGGGRATSDGRRDTPLATSTCSRREV